MTVCSRSELHLITRWIAQPSALPSAGVGNSGSVFIKIILGRLFSEFVPDKKVEYDMYDDTISVRISLGSGWDEHDY